MEPQLEATARLLRPLVEDLADFVPWSRPAALAMRRLDIKPEHECFDLGHVGSLAALVDTGPLETPLHGDFVMGVLGGVPATARRLPSSFGGARRRLRKPAACSR